MTVERDVVLALSALVDGRVYLDDAPLGTPLPFIVFQQVGGKPLNYLAGVPDKKNGRFQIDVQAATRLAASRLIRRVEDLLKGHPVLQATVLNGALATREPQTGMYGAMQDFSIWFAD